MSQYYILHHWHEIPMLSHTLAKQFPHPDNVISGIHELLINAVEHGNLELGFTLKTRLFQSGLWESELKKRIAMPYYARRRVNIEVIHGKNECHLTIIDQGKGFLWTEYLKKPIPSKNLNGRGLVIAFAAGFNSIKFNNMGNQVTCTSRY